MPKPFRPSQRVIVNGIRAAVHITVASSLGCVTDPRGNALSNCDLGSLASDMFPPTLTIEVGATERLTVQYYSDYNPPECRIVSDNFSLNWASENPQLVAVDSHTRATLIDPSNPYALISNAVIRGVAPGGPIKVGILQGGLGSPSPEYTMVTVAPGAALVTVSSPTPSVTIGTPVTLAAVVTDASGSVMSGRALTWATSNPSIATVSGAGSVSGLTQGTVTITAQDARSGRTGSIALDVRSAIALLEVNPPNARLGLGAQLPVGAVFWNASGTLVPLSARDVTWTSDNAAVATVAEQQNQAASVTAVAIGTAHITATTEGVSGFATVTVEPPIDRVVATPATLQIPAGQNRAAVANVLDGAGNPIAGHLVTWQSSAPTVATATPPSQTSPATATINGLAIGTATITATSEGKSATISVTVTTAAVAVSSVSITPASSTVEAGSTVPLTARTFGGAPLLELNGRGVTWRSLNTAVAQVGGGSASPSTVTVSGVSAGSATIEASSEGVTATATVTVTAAPPPPPPTPRIAYALADQSQPIPPTYSANPTYAYNSRGSAITFTRVGVGRYRVNFPGQSAASGETETVLVNSYGGTHHTCKVGTWGNGANVGIDADVNCYTLGGLPQDAEFTITLLGNDALTGRFGFGLANQASSLALYTPSKMATTGTGPISVRKDSTGAYTVKLPGSGGSVGEPEGIMVTGAGSSNERCQPSDTFTGDSFHVNCWLPTLGQNIAADATFVFVMLTRGRSGQRAAYAYVDDSDVIDAGGTLTLSSSVSYNSSGGTVRVVHTGVGTFNVVFANLLASGVSRRFGVNVVNQDEDEAGVCSIVDWTPSGSDLLARVSCFANDASPVDEAFFIIVIE